MDLLLTVLFYNFIGSLLSLIGGLLLILTGKSNSKIIHILSSFAAGTLLGTVFFDLLPEAIEHSFKENVSLEPIFVSILGGILFFFILERFLHWFHNHDYDHTKFTEKPVIPLILVGDSIHNFIDGVAIAATFMVNIPLGIITTFAVAAHEIPQEIGDFAIMLKSGISKWRVLLINILSAAVSILGVLFTFYFGNQVDNFMPYFIGITSGFFLYIALSSLIPEIHHENKRGIAAYETLFLFVGVGFIYFAVYFISNVLNLSH